MSLLLLSSAVRAADIVSRDIENCQLGRCRRVLVQRRSVRRLLAIEGGCGQARASWQWFNFCAAQVPVGKTLLRVNTDETAICLFQGGGKGNVFVSRGEAAAQHVPRSRTRTYLTRVAFVCDNPLLQARLPQILVANTHTVSAAEHAALAGTLPPNFKLLRCQSAWMNERLAAQIVRWLRDSLSDVLDEYHVVLVLDAFPAHTTPLVFRACTATAIWPVLVPAQATWLLQPLDTHGFLSYKVRLQRAYQEARLSTETGEVRIGGLLSCIVTAVRDALESRDWASAFTSDGFSPGQMGVSERVLNHLQLTGAASAPRERPSPEQLALCFPRNRVVPVAAIWRRIDARSASSSGAVVARAAPTAAVVAGPHAPEGRRSSARLAARAALAAASDMAPPRSACGASGASCSSGSRAGASSVAKARPFAKVATRRMVTRSMSRSSKG